MWPALNLCAKIYAEKKYGNRKKHEFLNRMYNSKSYLRRKKLFASFIGLTLSGLNREPLSIWVYERVELWFNRMLNENFNVH